MAQHNPRAYGYAREDYVDTDPSFRCAAIVVLRTPKVALRIDLRGDRDSRTAIAMIKCRQGKWCTTFLAST